MHAPILPIVIPLCAAVLLLLIGEERRSLLRSVSLFLMGLLGVCAIALLWLAYDGSILVYRLGDWAAPFGIVLVLDRLAALMVAVSAAVAFPALLYASQGFDARGRHFHALFHFQLAGINGAFLAGDIFNLFVFFEILLLASYALQVHGGGRERIRAGFSYVALNLLGSAVFLFGLGLLYGTLGTLNMADIAVALQALPESHHALARAALALIIAVFLLKAAILPLSFWLPHTYGSAGAPVAALFALLTKVGIYALLRLSTVDLSAVGWTATLLSPWLMPLALSTIVIGSVGALAAQRFEALTANLILVSTGVLLAALAAQHPDATAAALYYLPHTTFVTAAMFLLGDCIAAGRASGDTAFERGDAVARRGMLSLAYLVLAVAVVGLPPLSGFLGKLMMMQALSADPLRFAIWGALLASGFVAMIVLARVASIYFWQPGEGDAPAKPFVLGARRALPLLMLVLASPLLTVGAAPVADFAMATARQLHDRSLYIDAVLGEGYVPQREVRQ